MSGSKGSGRHGMQSVFVFVLLGLFAVMSTLIVVLGAQMYRGIVDRSGQNNDHRVLSAYVRSMLRAEDAMDSVAIERLDGITALKLKETIDGDDYVTWIYPHEGQLYEQFTELEYEFEPENGTPVCPVGSFDAEIDGDLVTVHMTDVNGQASTVSVALRCA